MLLGGDGATSLVIPALAVVLAWVGPVRAGRLLGDLVAEVDLTPLDAALAGLVLATHGIADTVVTAWGVAETGTTVVERNPLLKPAAGDAHVAAHESGLSGAVVEIAAAKLPAVLLAVALLLVARTTLSRRRWRQVSAALGAAGMLVVLSNLFKLAQSWGVGPLSGVIS
jgi:hypothetical protein